MCWFGNCLVPTAPAPAAYEDWLAVHSRRCAGVAVRRRVVAVYKRLGFHPAGVRHALIAPVD